MNFNTAVKSCPGKQGWQRNLRLGNRVPYWWNIHWDLLCMNALIKLFLCWKVMHILSEEKKVLNLLSTEVSTHFLIKRKLLYPFMMFVNCVQQWVIIIEKLNCLESVRIVWQLDVDIKINRKICFILSVVLIFKYKLNQFLGIALKCVRHQS